MRRRLEARKTACFVGVAKPADRIGAMCEAASAHRTGAIAVYVERVADARRIAARLARAHGAERVAVLTGTLRGHERSALVAGAVWVRFSPERERTRALPSVVLVMTSAGEVGVDLDADHAVTDLAPLDSMIQRLGRVNRAGLGSATVTIVHAARDSAAVERRGTVAGRLPVRRETREPGICPGRWRGWVLYVLLGARARYRAFRPVAPTPAGVASFGASRLYANAPCSIWDDTSRSRNTTGRPFAGPRSSPASSNSTPMAPRGSGRSRDRRISNDVGGCDRARSASRGVVGDGPLALRTAPGAGAVRVVRGGHRLPPAWSGLGTRDAGARRTKRSWRAAGRPSALYRASDALMAHREAIEHHLFDRSMGLSTCADGHADDLTNAQRPARAALVPTPAASCAAPRCSPATCENTTRWPKCSKRSLVMARNCHRTLRDHGYRYRQPRRVDPEAARRRDLHVVDGEARLRCFSRSVPPRNAASSSASPGASRPR